MNNIRFGPPLSPGIRALIIFNSVIFLVDFFIRSFLNSDFIIYYFALIPELILKKFFIWQIFTYQFLHGGFFHILFNMATLWMFGSELEYKWGKKKFIKYYLITGAMTGIIIFLFNSFMGLTLPTIGASGVVFAIMLAYAIYWGNRIMFPIPIKVKYFVMIMGIGSFLTMINPGQSNISHIGHLGGLISGYLYFKLFIENKNPSPARQANLLSGFKKWKKKKEWEKKDKERYDNMNMEQQVDEILGKISRSGLKSLTDHEKKILKRASENLNDKRRH